MATLRRVPKRRWRFFRTESGADPIRRFLDELDDGEAAQVVAAMADVRKNGTAVSKHLRGDIYEVTADAATRTFRVLFAGEGKQGQVLLAVVAFDKKTQKTPPKLLHLAERRLAEWRRRGVDRKRRRISGTP